MKKQYEKIARDAHTASIWQQLDPEFKTTEVPIDRKTVYDVLIIGGGITGLTTALILQKAGKKCILAEAYALGFGTTSGTSAHLNTFFDATYPEIDSDFGKEASQRVAKAGQAALNTIKNFIDEYQIDCDYETKDGFLFSETDEETKQLEDILQSALHAGVAVAETTENGTNIPFQNALKFEDQAQFHPTKYLFKLAEAFINLGGIISEDTFINALVEDKGLYSANSDQLTITAKHVVYATHVPPGINLFNFKCAPYRSYVLGIKLSDHSYPNCLIYDMQEPYHYLRTHVIDGEKLLILGGEDHKTGHGDPEAAFDNLEKYARKHFKVAAIPFKWSAQYYVPADGLPYIGKMPLGGEQVYVATGFNGNGMQFGTLSAMIISDLILEKENEFSDLFSSTRIKPIAGFTEFIKENADVAYHFVADRFSATDLEYLSRLKPDEGKIVDFKDQKLAIYKSKAGKVTALSPVCTHAGCIVNFNAEEKSWDCPCHGGRFTIDGKVISGPPQKALAQIDPTTL